MSKFILYKTLTTRTKKYLILFTTFLFFFSILSLLLLQKEPQELIAEDQNSAYTYDYSQIERFVFDINNNGADTVYQKVKQRTNNLPFATKHKTAHLFGKALYQAKKEAGISVCDTDLSYGCYHGLFIEAINTEGESAVPELDHFCEIAGKDLYSGCQHGIGHGLIEYLGRPQISKALEYCEKIQKNLLTGCSSGVFMEYFQPSGMNKDTSSFVLIDPNNPFAVCNSIDPKFIDSCIYELPRLWRRTESNFQKLTQRCMALQNPRQQKSCFRGIGYITGDTTNPNPERSISVCDETTNSQTKLYCLSGATWFYKTLDKTDLSAKAIHDLCSHSIDESLCKELSDLNLDQI